MSVKITYFVHGTTFDNLEKKSSGWNDVELAPIGKEQALALRLTLDGKFFDVVISSDLKRAVDSAQMAFGDSGIQILNDKRIRECNYGDFNGKDSSVVEPLTEESIYTKFPNGESYEDVKERISNFLNYLKENYDGKHVALVAHKAPQIILDVLLKGQTYEEAFKNDWRKTKSWQPGWEYELN